MNIFIQPKNNRKTTRGRKRQQVLSAPRYIKISGRWKKNPDAHVIKTIIHVTTR